MSLVRAMTVACVFGGAVMAVAQTTPPSGRVHEPAPWRAVAGYSDRPFCQLYMPGVVEDERSFVPVPYWNAKDGWAIWFITHQKEMQSVRFESPGTPDAWNLTLEAARDDYHGRYALLPPTVADSMLRSLEQGHSLSVKVTYERLPSLDSPIPTQGAAIAASMYRACVQSLFDDPPPWYLFEPFAVFGAHAPDDNRCEFRQVIELEEIPVQVSLLAHAQGAEVTIARDLTSRNPHGPFQKRDVPDRVDATQLSGPSFDLVETFRFEITTARLNELVTELVRGKSRTLSITNKAGRKSELEFGGKWGKPTAAMFAACRKLRAG